jgi:hypothetical protein
MLQVGLVWRGELNCPNNPKVAGFKSALRGRLTVGQTEVPGWTDLGRAYVPAVGRQAS